MTFSKRLFAAAIAALVTFVAAPAVRTLPAYAQATVAAPAGDLAHIRQTGILRVGETGDYDPFTIAEPSGTYRGIDADAAGMLAKAIGPNVKVEVVKTSWPTISADLQAGKFDIAMGGISWNAARAQIGELSHPYIQDGKVALIRAADKAKFKTLADLDRPDVTVLVNPGGTNSVFVKDTIKNAKVVVVQDNLAIPGMIGEGKGDVMFTDGVEARLKAGRDHRLYAVDPDHPFTHSEHVYFMPKGQTALLDVVNAWIDKSKTDGTYTKLFAKYIGS
ncbi:MAG: transporter substrate-binding domain-containing protein [Vulcanimicrobiaceae bacterium]